MNRTSVWGCSSLLFLSASGGLNMVGTVSITIENMIWNIYIVVNLPCNQVWMDESALWVWLLYLIRVSLSKKYVAAKVRQQANVNKGIPHEKIQHIERINSTEEYLSLSPNSGFLHIHFASIYIFADFNFLAEIFLVMYCVIQLTMGVVMLMNMVNSKLYPTISYHYLQKSWM
jgi:hypothetical protein